jgi:hypothetical protein
MLPKSTCLGCELELGNQNVLLDNEGYILLSL